MAAPANGGDSFVLDMATSAVALGKVKQVYFDKPSDIPYIQKTPSSMPTDIIWWFYFKLESLFMRLPNILKCVFITIKSVLILN